jgi:transposase-like protein
VRQLDLILILTALGVDMAGNKDGWLSVLEDLRAHGATQMDFIVTDGHDRLLAVVLPTAINMQ